MRGRTEGMGSVGRRVEGRKRVSSEGGKLLKSVRFGRWLGGGEVR